MSPLALQNYNELLKKDDNFSQIINTIEETVYLYDIVGKKYDFISPNCLDLFDVSDKVFYLGDANLTIAIHPEDEKLVRDSTKLVDNGIPYNIEYRIISNGNIKWINEKSFPIKDENGNNIKNSGICNDITELKNARDLIKEQSQNINDSLNYAKIIQDSALPTQSKVDTIFPQNFIFYKPRDILSGDFYIIDEVRTNDKHSMSLVIVADCTGHGVPGAILSLLCNALLKESFTRAEINAPAEALGFVRRRLNAMFKAGTEQQIHDGMDVAFCVKDERSKQVYFAGANTSIFIIRNGEVIRHRGDRFHVGYSAEDVAFTPFSIPYEDGDLLYLFTDGFEDQFGGEKKKKFLKRNFLNLLVSNSHLTMSEQCKIIESTFYDWKGVNKQIDDVTVIGVAL